MANHLDEAGSRLSRSVQASATGWTGTDSGTFRAHWDEMESEINGGSGAMRDVADQLRAMAQELEAKNNLVQSIYVMVAATAGVSVLAGLVSFGAGFVAGSLAVAAHVARAERVLVAVRAFLMASRATLAALKGGRVRAFCLRFAGFAAQGTVATAAVKQVALDQDPTDLDNWSTADAVGVAAGGFTSAGLALRGASLAGTPARALASGFAADAATSGLVDVVGGNARAGQILTNAIISGTAGGALNRGPSPAGADRANEIVVGSRKPHPSAVPGGRTTKIPPRSDKATRRSLAKENDSAEALARAGYDVEQNPDVAGAKNPDYRIEGEVFDNYAPTTANARNIWTTVEDKVRDGQTKRVVINLADSPVRLDELRAQFLDWPIEGLQEVLVISGAGDVKRLFP